MKKTLEKVARDNGDPHLALLYLRSTPVDSKMPSPAQLLQGRTFHDTLPKISTRGDEEVMEHLEKKQQRQKVLYDQHTRKHTPLTPGQKVSVLNPSSHTWQPATVTEVCDEPRSYALATETGSEVQRNQAQIKTRQDPQPAKPVEPQATGDQLPSMEKPIADSSKAENLMTTSGRVVKAPPRLNL